MKKSISIIILIVLLFNSSIAFSEVWVCPSCNNNATGNFCNNCGAPASVVVLAENDTEIIQENSNEETITQHMPETGYSELNLGDRGVDVVALQTYLNLLGFDMGVADGDFGRKTEQAVLIFQQQHNIADTGIVDASTWKSLQIEIDNLSTTRYVVNNGNTENLLYGYIDRTGEVVIPYQFTEAENFHDGMALVKMANGKTGFIDVNGEVLFTINENIVKYSKSFFWAPDGFRNGTYHMYDTDTEETVYIDMAGNEFLRIEGYKDENNSFSEGYALIGDKEENRNARIVDKHGNEYHIPDIEIDTADDSVFVINGNIRFSEGLLPYHGSGYGFLNPKGEVAIPIEYQDALSFSEGLCAVQSGKWGYIDREGNTIIPFSFKEPTNFYNGVAVVKSYEKFGSPQYGKWGIVDTEGNFTEASFQWDSYVQLVNQQEIREFSDGLLPVVKNKKVGFIDTKGELVIPNVWDMQGGQLELPDVYRFRNGICLVTEGEYDLYYIDKEGNKLAYAGINEYTSGDSLKKFAEEYAQIKYSKEDCKDIAREYMKEHLYPYLKRPSSLELNCITTIQSGSFEYLFVFDISAMNSYGGYASDTYYCKVDNRTGEVVFGGMI